MMRRVLARLTGYLLLAAGSCWAALASVELARLSPVLWPLVLPGLALSALPAAAAEATAVVLLRVR
jgi:hypothetical protein